MERSDPVCQDDGKDIAERINDVLDPHSIPQADIESDDYEETQSVEDYLRNQKHRKN